MDFEQEMSKFKSLDFHPSQFSFFKECLEEHDDCKKAVGLEHGLPRRLIDLSQTAENILHPRLVLTKHIKHRPVQYVALSHSWSAVSESEKLSIMTTTQNQDQHAHGIDINSFPTNYQAVMVICRSFGFQYIWLDLLCIVQNDPEDWDEESVRMRQVYGTATLTIAINTSQNLFTMKRSKEAVPEWEDMRHQCGVNSHWTQPFLKRMVEGGFVGKRAWCLQERHLSPRLLHLLDNGVVIFECSQAKWSTNARNLFGLREKSTSHRKLAQSKRWIDIANELEHDILLQHWHDFLGEYQNRALTYNEDNLTALAGIAGYMQARTGWTYLSGIWKQDIVRGMLWESKGFEFRSEPSHTRFSSYHAPTWSWSSVSGSTRTIPEMMVEDGGIISVQSWRTKKSGGDPVQHRSLVPETSVEIAPTEGLVAPLSIDSTIKIKGILIEYQCTAQGAQCGLVTNLTEVGPQKATRLANGKITFDVPSEAYDGALWCLPLVVNQYNRHSLARLSSLSQTPSQRSCLGIGLQKVSPQLMPEEKRVGRPEGKDEAIHTFRRVGLVRLTLRKSFWFDLLPEARLLRII